ncbi:Aromatic hydroxylase fmpF [Lasiodiplodia hormozganensis]|uniref:Aromatic hydroxylase fmpF n=1 Tax=Lasiodiplodia hormozganensis TaxID=869390 RepID=A0AA40D818_9PEZI|nr:Aromatic hydroxylase fmpF [Lasiodiplodia hormozganensis]
MLMPRERNMTRVYVELKPELRGGTSRDELSQQLVMQRAKEIMYPFRLKWKTVEWFGRYVVGQRVSTKFADHRRRVFICGDAAHTHSPKAAQGMNTSMHDAWNLAWKLNFAVRKLAKPELLATYEVERRRVAEDLINFDYEHAKTFAAGDWDALAKNFASYTRFISGMGAEYEPNALNRLSDSMGSGDLKPGCLPTPAKATRYADANPVDVQLDIPMLGQFRIYFFCNSARTSRPFIDVVCRQANSQQSFTGRMSAATDASYTIQPPIAAPHDEFICPGRYTTTSCLFTWALITPTPRAAFELADLPQVLRESPWTVYLDDIPWEDTRGKGCIEKWLGGLQGDETALAIIRPDGYVGTLRIWQDGSRSCGKEAVEWMDEYFEGFLSDIV